MSSPAFAQRGINSYRQTEIRSRSPLELIVMLYDGALRCASDAVAAIGRKDIAARRDAISRALAIVSELQSMLDMERGGALAIQLDGLYTFVSGRLLDAAIQQDARPIHDAIRVLTTLRDAWAAIALESHAPQATTTPSR